MSEVFLASVGDLRRTRESETFGKQKEDPRPSRRIKGARETFAHQGLAVIGEEGDNG